MQTVRGYLSLSRHEANESSLPVEGQRLQSRVVVVSAGQVHEAEALRKLDRAVGDVVGVLDNCEKRPH